MSLRDRFVVVSLSVITPVSVLAHPGHGTESAQGWFHYLAEPAHYGLAALALLAVLAGLRFGRSLSSRAGNG